MNISKTRLVHGVLMFSLPLNLVVFQGFGNLYLSTLLIFLMTFAIFLPDGKLFVNHKGIYWLIFVFVCQFIVTTINLIADDFARLNTQLNISIAHLQLLLVFLLSQRFFNSSQYKRILNLFMITVLLATVRVVISEYGSLFSFSVLRGERIEALFIGGVNNFALLMSLALIITLFSSINKLLKATIGIYLLFLIIATLSRGAIFSLFLAGCMMALIYRDKFSRENTVYMIFLVAIFVCVGHWYSLQYPKLVEVLTSVLENRFLGLFDSDTSATQFSSGRTYIVADLAGRFIENPSILKLVFGHGMGSIEFYYKGHLYESSHNIYLDVLYRNGLIVFLLYMMFLLRLSYNFWKYRMFCSKMLLMIFIFIHIEFLFNPFLYAVQVGWVYSFLMYFIVYHIQNIRSIKCEGIRS